MYAEDLATNDSGDWEAIEHVNERPPCLYVTPLLALVIKSVHCRSSAKTEAKRYHAKKRQHRERSAHS